MKIPNRMLRAIEWLTDRKAAIRKRDQKKAAMALNLCSASISRIISSGDLETMEQEYNAILNNLNLRSIVHDEALLEIMRKILDVITFFRLADHERKMIEEQHNQRMNNLLWNGVMGGGNLFFVGTANPWAIATMIAVQFGSMFVGYRRGKREALARKDEALWKLEHSAIEQLHGLRAALFETSWRLSDAYSFKDEWRLTTKQIDWFNQIREEEYPRLRYRKLRQFEDDFKVYPYYWYERGVAAQEIAESECKMDSEKSSWYIQANDDFMKFLELDAEVNILRQDMIGADARIRHIVINAQPGMLDSWDAAIEKDRQFLESCVDDEEDSSARSGCFAHFKRMAVDDPELVFKAALMFATAFRELSLKENLDPKQQKRKTKYGEAAVMFFDMLVSRECNLPMSSIFLSELYLLLGKREEYDNLRLLARQYGDGRMCIVPDNDKDASDRFALLRLDWLNWFNNRCAELPDVFSRAFDAVQKLALPGIYNVQRIDVNGMLRKWAAESYNRGQDHFQHDLFSLWDAEKTELNILFKYVERSLGFNHDALDAVAQKLSDLSYAKIVSITPSRVFVPTAAKKAEHYAINCIDIVDWQAQLHAQFVDEMLGCVARSDLHVLEGYQDVFSPDEIKVRIATHIDGISKQHGLIAYESEEESGLDVHNDFFVAAKDAEVTSGSDLRIDIRSYLSDSRTTDYYYRNGFSFTVMFDRARSISREYLLATLHSRYPSWETSWEDKSNGLLEEKKDEAKNEWNNAVKYLKEDLDCSVTWGERLMACIRGGVECSIAAIKGTVEVAKSAAQEQESQIKEGVGNVLGRKHFTITIKDDCVEIKNNERQFDEAIRNPERLSFDQLQREAHRLVSKYQLTDDDKRRLTIVLKKWVSTIESDYNHVQGDRKKEDVLLRANAFMRSLSQNANAERWAAEIQQGIQDAKTLMIENRSGLPLLAVKKDSQLGVIVEMDDCDVQDVSDDFENGVNRT